MSESKKTSENQAIEFEIIPTKAGNACVMRFVVATKIGTNHPDAENIAFTLMESVACWRKIKQMFNDGPHSCLCLIRQQKEQIEEIKQLIPSFKQRTTGQAFDMMVSIDNILNGVPKARR